MSNIQKTKDNAIFSKNLRKYIELNEKSQVDVCKDLGIKTTTFNMWCSGKSMPKFGTLRMLADYFGIGVTDLTEEKSAVETDEEYADAISGIELNDERFKKIVISYSKMPKKKRDIICDFFEEFII